MVNDWNSAASQEVVRDRWAGEVTPLASNSGAHSAASLPQQSGNRTVPPSSGMQPRNGETLNMRVNLPQETVNAPTTLNEAYLGSLKALLSNNKGNYVVASFLIGTQNPVSWEGFLYDVGNDFLTLYQEGRDRYIVCDLYSLKFIEFYDTRGQIPYTPPALDQAFLNQR